MSQPSSSSSLKVFISYAHEDDKWRIELEKHLSNLQNQGLISNWSDRQISAGAEWEAEINRNLEAAQIILLLISSAFMASDFCYSKELERAIERHNAGEARVIPIIVRYVDWDGAPFEKLQAVPTDGKPIVSSKWDSTDQAFVNVIRYIRKAVKELNGSV